MEMLYKDPQFYVSINGKDSQAYKQKTGIRQGCTLSPYLFLMVMSAIFHDVHKDAKLQRKLKRDRPPNHDFDEVLYADDTIIFPLTQTWSKNTYKKSKNMREITDLS